MRILDKYLYKELLATFLAVLAVLLLITFGAEATKLLAYAVEGKVPASVLMQLLLLKLPAALEVILPLIALLGVMLALGRLYQDQEMVVLQSCGVPASYFKWRVFWFLLPWVLFTAWVSLWLTPWSFEQARSLTQEAKEVSPLAALVPGKFNELPGGAGVLYAQEIAKDGSLSQLWLQLNQTEQPVLLTAPTGRFEWVEGRLALVLSHGYSYQGLDAGSETVVRQFARFEGYLPDMQIAMEKQHRFGISSEALWQNPTPSNLSLLQWRIVTPLSVLVMGLLALKMSKTKPREGRFAKLFLALVLYVIYNQGLVTFREMVRHEQLDPWIGLWPVPFVFLLFALYSSTRVRPKIKPVSSPSNLAEVHP